MSTRVTWLGHSTLLVETHGHTILIDPFFTGNPACPVGPDGVNPTFILVSHGHGDHVGDAVAIARRTGATVVANYEIADWFTRQGVAKVHGMQHGGGFAFPCGRVDMTIAFHGSALPDGSYGGNPAGFVLTTPDGKKIYDAADTGLFSDMRLIGEKGLDLAMVPIGDNFTMGPDDAVRAIEWLAPKRAFPIHFNTWPLIAQDGDAWVRRVRAATGCDAFVLKPGESVEV